MFRKEFLDLSGWCRMEGSCWSPTVLLESYGSWSEAGSRCGSTGNSFEDLEGGYSAAVSSWSTRVH